MMKVTVVFAGNEEFGIDINRVVEILKVPRIYLLPRLPSFLSGVVNIRGAVIPLMDLRKRFDIDSAARKERVVIVLAGGEKVGLLVDGVKEIVNLAAEEVVKPPSMFKGLKTEFIAGIGKKGDSIIILLNLDTLLSAKEKSELEEVSRSTGTDHGRDEKASQ